MNTSEISGAAMRHTFLVTPIVPHAAGKTVRVSRLERGKSSSRLPSTPTSSVGGEPVMVQPDWGEFVSVQWNTTPHHSGRQWPALTSASRVGRPPTRRTLGHHAHLGMQPVPSLKREGDLT